jgi:NAD(P)-dependent dehydrogenase (short-subunit alcohol dehydrogenase family)
MLDALAPFRLDGRTAIVTGASSGLGARFAAVLAGVGATTILTARRADRLDSVAADIPGAITAPGDVTSDEHLASLVALALERTGRLDIVINNAGISDVVAAQDEPMAQFRETMDVNLTATFALSQLAFRPMETAGTGTIVNIASVLGMVASGQIPQAGYTASKGAVINLTRELAAQWSRQGIRVNALCPGWFASEMTAGMFADDRAMRWIERKTPMGRSGHAQELDGALLLLASDAGSYITGQVLVVDGGYTAV